MFSIKQLGEKTYYVDLPSKIGIYKLSENEVVFIDSSADEGTAKRALKLIGERGWNLRAIYNTHCHADHVGGNAYLQENTGCKIYCPEMDCAAVKHTILNPIMLHGGYPLRQLFHKFYFAADSAALPLCEEALPEGLEAVELPGHTLGQVGFKTSDGVFFVADSLSSALTIDRYKATYLVDISKALKTFELLENSSAEWFVASHCEPTQNVRELTEVNRQSVFATRDFLLEACKAPKTHEQLVKLMFQNSTVPFNMVQYALLSSTTRSYLAWLQAEELIETLLDDYAVYYKAVE